MGSRSPSLQRIRNAGSLRACKYLWLFLMAIEFHSDDVQMIFAGDIAKKLEDSYPVPPNVDDSGTISLAFLISLSVTFALLMVVLVIIAIYVTFCGADEAEYDEETGGTSGAAGPFHSLFSKKRNAILLDSSFTSAGQFDDDALLQEQEATELPKMSPFELDLYNRAKEFQKVNPPNVKEFGTFTNESDLQFIRDRGIQSYSFLPSINDNTDVEGNFLPSFLIQDKLDITFTKYNKSSSAIMNYPLPFNRKDAVYFEVKVFRHPSDSNAIFSIGLMTFPYPYFRIPGMSLFSIAYESTGKLRINNPFMASTLLPKLQEGDVVGFGYRFRTGTIFITHNGKRLIDVTQNVGIDLFVGIGSLNAAFTRTYTRDGLLEDPDNIEMREGLSEGREVELPPDLQRVHDVAAPDAPESDEVELHVNLGQVGFVFIEANVKKYGFGSVYGEIGIPPSYNGNETKTDTILQKGADIPPEYSDTTGPDEFFGNIHINSGGSATASSSNLLAPRTGRLLSAIPEIAESDLERYERNSSAYDQEYNHSLMTNENVGLSRLSSVESAESDNKAGQTSARHNERTPLINRQPLNRDDDKHKRKRRKRKKRSKK
ncbi:hypothetical protein HG536_0A03790 [Torulaspora globosa]|uniref:SPRY domain-containing protein n=1 Tax=Torulaspora globosa TaxID=48254 RepID=A0A7G3ZAM5_9SACH|nr:uncharacterized protein HG536_0A03790 [Torulaspora globosa]QLL30561.1 hypothetical protein HG536_0A03790 [Torulaspora globosa]